MSNRTDRHRGAGTVDAGLALAALDAEFEHRHALDVIDWAVTHYGDSVGVSSSFGADSAVMLHLAVTVKPDIKVVTVDTGFLFPETIAFRDELARRLDLNLHVFRPAMEAEAFVETHGQMWSSNPTACCAFNKQEPFERAKRTLGLEAWITGIRREQSSTRRAAPFVVRDFDGLLKVCPIADWTNHDVHYYLQENELPYHPLRNQGYLSLGCTHCTKKVELGQDPRAGRWAGFDKTECGLHNFEGGSGI